MFYLERKRPTPGSFYRHFKGQLYQVKGIARHSETQEEMVIYQAMYPPFSMWVRPLDLFVSPVDTNKYPEVKQKYRFEEVRFAAAEQKTARQKIAGREGADQKNAEQKIASEASQSITEETPCSLSDQELYQALVDGLVEKKLLGRLPEQEIARRGFLAFLDAVSYREKRLILTSLKPYLNDVYLNNIAVALDMVLEQGTKEDHYEAILYWLETHARYEGGRLRQ